MNNETKQTAVEWLIDQMFKQGYFDGNKPLTFTNLDHLQQQAKEMEKERMIQFAKQCLDKALDLDVRTAYLQVENYYNETYGGNK
jgi:hypothetical protein